MQRVVTWSFSSKTKKAKKALGPLGVQPSKKHLVTFGIGRSPGWPICMVEGKRVATLHASFQKTRGPSYFEFMS